MGIGVFARRLRQLETERGEALAHRRIMLESGQAGHLPRSSHGASRDDHAVEGLSPTEQVIARVRATPPGFVRAYRDVSPGAPRFAGTVLARCKDPALPWHRIVRADGSLAKGARQRALLEAEGVPFHGDVVDMRAARLPDL